MRYRADIDGLRALAVLPVVLFHAHVAGVRGGFVGVDVFFVISGYLICSLIAQELQRGDFSILRFYERRCRRILPALFTMFFATAVAAGVILMPPDLASFGRSLLSSVMFVSNMYFWKDSGYFDGSAEFKPLLHTWSLSVEEQFYLVVPYLLVAISVFCRRRYIACLLPLALASLGVSIWGVAHAPNAAYYVLPTRFWEILLGGLLGVGALSGPASRAVREPLALAGLALLLGSALLYSDATPFPGLAALAPCGGAALIIYAGTGGMSTVGRLLSSSPVVFVGKLSYSLYLWHWPLFALYRYRVAREFTGLESAALVALSFVLALLSWQFVERPFRQGVQPMRRRLVFQGALAGALVAGALGGTAVATNGLPFRVPSFEPVDVAGEREYDAAEDGSCFLSAPQTYRDWGGDRCFVTRGQGPTVLLWGDSFAAHYVPGLARHASEMRADILEYTLSACPPVFGFDTMSNPPCREFNDHIVDVIQQYHVKGVIVSSRWDYAFKRHIEPRAITATLDKLRALGVTVDVIGQSPLFGNSVQTLFAQADGKRAQPDAWGYINFSPSLNDRLGAAMPSGVNFVDPLQERCHLSSCQYRHEQNFMMLDEGHFSAYGSALAVESYFPYLHHG